jgi:hypothetical protein
MNLRLVVCNRSDLWHVVDLDRPDETLCKASLPRSWPNCWWHFGGEPVDISRVSCIKCRKQLEKRLEASG